jgi:prepilin peptidase dependent protein B
MLNPRHRRAASRGLSIVELMVGVTIGLLIVGAALQLSGRNIASARSMLTDVRVNQDLRALGDLVSRDLRRAGYWDNAILGTRTTAAGSTTTANPYAGVTAGSATVTYAFTRDATEDNALGTAEQFGFRLLDGRVEMQTAQGTWQPVTDPAVLTITAFTITPATTVLPLGDLCPTTCAPGAPNCPTVTVRRYDLLIRGQSVRDAAVVRELRSSVRVRNDQFGGACPA